MSKTDAIVDKLYATLDKIEDAKTVLLEKMDETGALIGEAITLAREAEVIVPKPFVDARTGVHGRGARPPPPNDEVIVPKPYDEGEGRHGRGVPPPRKDEFGGIRHKRRTSKHTKKSRKSRKNRK